MDSVIYHDFHDHATCIIFGFASRLESFPHSVGPLKSVRYQLSQVGQLPPAANRRAADGGLRYLNGLRVRIRIAPRRQERYLPC